MTIKINPLPAPNAHAILGDSAFAYPDDYMFPVQTIIRDAFVNYREAFEAGAEFTVPGYGVLTTAGRAYTFDTTAQYRKAKDYPEQISGVWG